MIRRFVTWNRALSKAIDRRFFVTMIEDGNRDFNEDFAWRHLKNHRGTLADIGSGKQPFLENEHKYRSNWCVIGLDISQSELDRAPKNSYDETVCSPIETSPLSNVADAFVCQAVLEHVADNELAFNRLCELLKPGGIGLIFVPSRNAVFARLNLMLPESVKRRLLFYFFPESSYAQGFRSFYHRCTPKQFMDLAQKNGLDVVETKTYMASSYFSFFAPLYVVWRLWQVLFQALAGTQAAETFCMAVRKTRH
jgi:SAM-dependent methyltransferase